MKPKRNLHLTSLHKKVILKQLFIRKCNNVNKKKQILFSITIGDGSGFTDHIHNFSLFYKLGKYLGLNHYYKPLWQRPAVVKSETIIGFKSSKLKSEKYANAYEFIGFDQYFSASKKNVNSSDLKPLSFKFDEQIGANPEITDLESLITYLKRFILNHQLETDLTILLDFTFKKQINEINWLLELPNSLLDFNIKDIYSWYREQNPWPDYYRQDQSKIMIHIRQGDIATIKTPWGKFISLWDWKNKFMNQYDSIGDINNPEIMLIEDYYNFYSDVQKHFATHNPMALIHSDGFARSFLRLFNLSVILKLTKEQVLQIEHMKNGYDKKMFEDFEKMENVKLFIGEETEKFFDMLHAFYTADIIVVGTQNRMLQKLYTYSFSGADAPLLITLYHKTKPYYNYLGNTEMLKHCMYVDLDNYKISEVVKEVEKHIKPARNG